MNPHNTPEQPVCWQADLPPAPGRVIPVVIPRPGYPLQLGIVGRHLVGVMTHWLDARTAGDRGRTVPHLTDPDLCVGCRAGCRAQRWHGYLACWDARLRRYVIADLSTSAVRECTKLQPRLAHDLRGYGITLTRAGIGSSSRVIATLSESRFDTTALRESFDVVSQLMRIWGYRQNSPLAVDNSK